MRFITINSNVKTGLVIAPEAISHVLEEDETVTIFTKTGESYVFDRITVEIGEYEWKEIIDSWPKEKTD